MTIPEGNDNTIGVSTMKLDKTVNIQIPFTGEDIAYLNDGPGFEKVYGQLLTRKVNGMLKVIEAEVASTALLSSTRAVGVAGTTPFGTDHGLIADARKVLFDNDVSVDAGDLSIVMDSSAGANLRKLSNLQSVNTSGSTDLLRRGTLLDLQGFMLKESSKAQSHTKGTGAGYLVNNAGGYAVGDTAITVDTGAGTILAGDVITFAGDANKYVVASALAANVVTISAPGLREAAADNTAITVGASYVGNMAYSRSAIELAIRPMAGSMASAATDITQMQDPQTGITYQVELYGGYKKAIIDITLVYGVHPWNGFEISTILG